MDELTEEEIMDFYNCDDESQFFTSASTTLQHEITDSRLYSGYDYVMNILNDNSTRPYNHFRMNKTKFQVLCEKVMAKGIVNTRQVTIEEQVGMFLHILGHATNMRTIGTNFNRSVDTVHRTFNDVLWSVIEMRGDYIRLPGTDAPRHASVADGTNFSVFKEALGAIDGTHVPAIVKKKKHMVHINRKGFVSQNVMAAVDFDMKFVYVSVGWEGSAADMKVLRAAIERGGFSVPLGRYYLADAGYANTSNFMCPYRGHMYHLAQFRQVSCSNRYQSSEDLFNHRHAQLRNIVERAFGVLKNRFKILRIMHPYKYKKQCVIVLACCILHNYIKTQNEIEGENDMFFDGEEEVEDEEHNGLDEEHVNEDESAEEVDPTDLHVGEVLRTTIKNSLWEEMQRHNHNRRTSRN